ncbi:MAG: hypothetical protein GY953_17930 [bacterium]|nr:hypothetical protein [bacterium]
MASKKATKRRTTKKKTSAAPETAIPETNIPRLQRIGFHNLTNKAVSWTASGGGCKEKGVTPPLGCSAVRLNYARSYRVTMWTDPAKKLTERCPPHGHAIFTGRKIIITVPH